MVKMIKKCCELCILLVMSLELALSRSRLSHPSARLDSTLNLDRRNVAAQHFQSFKFASILSSLCNCSQIVNLTFVFAVEDTFFLVSCRIYGVVSMLDDNIKF